MTNKEDEIELFKNLVSNVEFREKWVELNKRMLIDYFIFLNPHLADLTKTNGIKVEVEEKKPRGFSSFFILYVNSKYLVIINFGHVSYIVIIDSRYDLKTFEQGYRCTTFEEFMDYRRDHAIDILFE